MIRVNFFEALLLRLARHQILTMIQLQKGSDMHVLKDGQN